MTRPLPHLADADREKHAIARINALTAAGRTNWFGLLAYLVFAFITVLGVEDADFFIPSRQTKLPVVGVEIPTEAFFFFAPVLGAALYVYLHLYVRKVTAALCMAPARIKGDGAATSTPLERHITPWLLNDLVLRWRRDTAIDPRPLDALASITAIALVWGAGPLVLAAMWIRSWPAHNQAITTLAGLCLVVALYAGWVSFVRLRRDLRGLQDVTTFGDLTFDFVFLFLAMGMLNLGWIKTESGVPYQKVGKASASLTGSISVFFATIPNVLDPDWWGALTPARLAEVQFAALPPDQADPTAARAAFRESWCKRHGMDAKTCGPAPAHGRQPFPNADELHDAWCADRGIETAGSSGCADRIAAMETAFTTEWRALRKATLAALPKPDLRETDLRGADLSNASLTGVILREARLDGANLSDARMEGVNLRDAQLTGANLDRAQLVGADFLNTNMNGATLRYAQLTDAYLSFAKMQDAILQGAVLDGADMRYAQLDNVEMSGAAMTGANLENAQLPGAVLNRAVLERAILNKAYMSGAHFKYAQMAGAALRTARLEGADLSDAWLDRADLQGAQLTGATLQGAFLKKALLGVARLEGADLRHTQMQGADLTGAKMAGALFWNAQLNEAIFRGAWMQGVDLVEANLARADWYDTFSNGNPVGYADLRAAGYLDQSKLSTLTGNAATLLPEPSDGEAPLYVPSCWTADPLGFDALIASLVRVGMSEESIRDPIRGWFCASGERPAKTGTPWPLDRDPPWVEEGIERWEWIFREDAKRRAKGPFLDPAD